MRTHVFESIQELPRTLEVVFPFFANARNLETLTPAWLQFSILTPGEFEMRPGTLIDYRIRIRGIPVRWRTEILCWEPPRRFIDKQIRGPYRLWVHEHAFEENEGTTTVRDRVQYAVPGGEIVRRLVVAPDIERIFAFRRRKLEELFGRSRP